MRSQAGSICENKPPFLPPSICRVTLREAVFPPYDSMKVLYPELKKCPGFLPYYWIKRLMVKSGNLKINIKKMDYSVVTEESYQEIQDFFSAGGYNA